MLPTFVGGLLSNLFSALWRQFGGSRFTTLGSAIYRRRLARLYRSLLHNAKRGDAEIVLFLWSLSHA